MLPHRRRRLILILCMLLGIGAASALALYALRQNINLFYSPKEMITQKVPAGTKCRLGGMVKVGSVHRVPQSAHISFVLTDGQYEVSVQYDGLLPDLFHEGKGIVTEGALNSQGVFVASLVLAKHDERYMPKGKTYAR